MQSALRVLAIRGLVLTFLVAIAIDTLPSTWFPNSPFKKKFNTVLRYLGVWQGDWRLFAPNPRLKNTWIEAEVNDRLQHESVWRSPAWEQASVWYKFYGARHLNYYQRVGRQPLACEDFADYLRHSIPQRERVTPKIRWSEEGEILPPADLAPPIVRIRLYEYRQRVMLREGEPLPKQSETNWTQQSNFLVQREYAP